MSDEPHGQALAKRQLANWLRAEWRQLMGRDYRIDLEALSLADLEALKLLTRDFEHDKQMAVNKAKMMPWRRTP